MAETNDMRTFVTSNNVNISNSYSDTCNHYYAKLWHAAADESVVVKNCTCKRKSLWLYMCLAIDYMHIYHITCINSYTFVSLIVIKLCFIYLMLQEANVFTVISPRSVLRLLPLYWATSVSPVDKSTCTCSNTFFFGFNWTSGSVNQSRI